jgi:hypothetical protein
MEKTAAPFGRFEQHPIASRVWRTIGNAMQHDMNIYAGTLVLVETLAASPVNDFFNGKIDSLGVFTMEKSCGDPNFIGDFDAAEGLTFHRASLR